MSFIPSSELIQSSNSKVSVDYQFNAAQGTLVVNDQDFVKFLLVVNVTIGTTLFNPAESNKKGTIAKRMLNFDMDTSSCNNNDELLVLFESRPSNETEELLRHVLQELKVTNLILNEVHDLNIEPATDPDDEH